LTISLSSNFQDRKDQGTKSKGKQVTIIEVTESYSTSKRIQNNQKRRFENEA